MLSLFFTAALTVAFPQQPDIRLEIFGNENINSHQVFFAPHEDEHIANQYLAKKVISHQRRFLILKQSGNREIHLQVNGKTMRVDPNRIFTKAGIKQSIKKLNHTLSISSEDFAKASQIAMTLGQFIIKQMGGLDRDKTWVAVHNNTQGYKGDDKGGIGDVSMVRYRGKLTGGAKYLSQLTPLVDDEDDLFFVTEQQDFSSMESKHFNAVLQNPLVTTDPEEDDGSLSVYAQMNGIRYINIEAEREYQGQGKNHLPMQKKMIDYILSLPAK